MSSAPELRKTLGPVMLWGLGVGYVISGMYTGWNLGLPEGGPVGMLLATLLVSVLYAAFVPTYAELACAMPRAGGAFVYATRALGPGLGLLAGVAQWVEFVFAPPAIAAAIGEYAHVFVPGIPSLAIAAAAYVLFTAINIAGVQHSAVTELLLACVAVLGIVLFVVVTAPHVSREAFTRDGLPHGLAGIFPALPYAVWFYLGIEGVANVAEEAKSPQRDLARGFGGSMATLVLLALSVLVCAVGVHGWRGVVFPAGSDVPSDSPLPLVLSPLLPPTSLVFRSVVTLGLLGLVASFHGLLLAGGRATFEFGRVGYAPRFVAAVLPSRGTPAAALGLNLVVGLAALVSGKTGELITLSVLGALFLYGISMCAAIRLRLREPELRRPFRAPLQPLLPAIALCLSAVCFLAVAVSSPKMVGLFAGFLALAFGYYRFLVPASARERARVAAAQDFFHER